MTIQKLSLLVLAFALTALSGCAAVFNNNVESVLVETQPPGATLSVNGQVFGKTPAKVQLSHDESHVLLVELPGYETASATIGTHIGVGWVILDVLALPTLIIPIVDAVGGYWYELDGNQVFFNMTPGGAPANTPDNTPKDRPRDDGRPVS